MAESGRKRWENEAARQIKMKAICAQLGMAAEIYFDKDFGANV